jgi:hypothetical protein
VKAAAPAGTEGDLDRLVDDLPARVRRREPGRVAGRLQDLTQKAGTATSFWDEVRRAAPRVEKAKTGPSLWKRLPRRRIAIAAAVVLSLIIGARAWFPSRARPAIVGEATAMERKIWPKFLVELDLPGECDRGDRQAYLELARAPVVSAVTLKCLAREKDAGTSMPTSTARRSPTATSSARSATSATRCRSWSRSATPRWIRSASACPTLEATCGAWPRTRWA